MKEILDKIMELIDKAKDWVESLHPFLEGLGYYVLGAVALLILLIIILIIIACIKKKAKKNAKKKVAIEEAKKELHGTKFNPVPTDPTFEQTMIENVLPEPTVEESYNEPIVSEPVETDNGYNSYSYDNSNNYVEPEPEPTIQESEPKSVEIIPQEKIVEEPIKEIEPEIIEEKVEPVKEKKPIQKTKKTTSTNKEKNLKASELFSMLMEKQLESSTEEPTKEEKVTPKKSTSKSTKKTREKSGPKELDLNFTPDRVIPDPIPKEELVEEVVVEEKPEPKVKKVIQPKEPKAKETPKKEEKKGVQGKFVLVREGETNWRYKLKASNGEIIIVSEPYTSEKSVRNGIDTLKKNLNNSKLEFVEDKHGLFYFMILTMQGRCLATSATYKTKARATSASESYRRWAETDIIIVDDNEDSEHTEVEEIKIEIEAENTGKYIIKKEGSGYIYQLLAANGVIVATSQVYKSKDSCLEACEAFRNHVYTGSFFVSKDKNDLYQFKLYNKQNRLVLAGEVYEEKSRVISVIEAIKRLAKLATVVEK